MDALLLSITANMGEYGMIMQVGDKKRSTFNCEINESIWKKDEWGSDVVILNIWE